MAQTISTPHNVIKFDQLDSLVKEVMAHPMEFGAVGLCGGPGIGKTQVIEDTASTLKKGLSYVNCNLVSPGDLLGAAFPSSDRRFTEFLPTRILNEENIIFFDELANGSNEMMNLANRVLLSGELNGRRFNEARFFAYNPTTVSDMANELPTILVNKGAIFIVDYRYNNFTRYALNEGHKRIHPGVAAFIAETKDSFLCVKDYQPLKHDGIETPAPGTPFPSPRSYELFSNLFRRVESGALDLNAYEVAYSTVGATAGKRLADYLVCSKYLVSTSKVFAGELPEFPEDAFVDGNLMSPIAYMTIYNLLGGISSKTDMAESARWLFTMSKKEVIGNEMLKVYAKALQESRFKDSFASVVGTVGKDVLGDKEFSKFMVSSISKDIRAGQF